MADTPELVSIDDLEAAAKRLADVAVRTPVEESRAVSEAAGMRAVLKCEHLQRTGSFKLRGAYNRIVGMSEEERARGVVCASAGNHAQGVALAARILGVRAKVFMPTGAPLPKVEANRAYGADVALVGDSFDDAYAASREWADEHGGTYVHPFDHCDIIAGQGTVGLEILEQVPDVGSVVVPVGGGGLISGVATAIKSRRPSARVIGVEPAGAAGMAAALAAGAPQPLEQVSTIADGLAAKTAGALTLAHVQQRVDEVVTVPDEVIAKAVLLLVERAKQVVEPAGAAGLAALMAGAGQLAEPVVVILSGGNVDPLLLLRILQSGLGEEGRYLAFRTRIDDRPGSLSRLLGLLAEHGANVVAIEHHRLGTRLDLLQVEIQVEVETRGPDHIRQLVSALREHGYPIA
ncbi:MAG TPA: threonine ammonia-lyase [Egibacteraceae bacterium]|nr:threonine ammonia-lyase [Egibacteraceae bacterium]